MDQRWSWKWNKIRGRIFNVAQRWCNVNVRRWNKVETTLYNVEKTLHKVGATLIKRCFNLASTLVKAILNPIEPVVIVDCEIVEYVLNTWIVFILLNKKTYFYYNHSTTNEISKNFPAGGRYRNTQCWSSCPEVFYKNFLNFTENHLCNFIKKETLAQVFFCGFCQISKNTFLHRTPLVAV